MGEATPSNSRDDPADTAQFFESLGSDSDARAKAVLPTVASEDASHLLGDPGLPPRSDTESDDREYTPSESIEWVITATFSGSPRLNPHKVSASFGSEWRREFGGFIAYGRDAESGRWTFLISADGPEAVTELKLGWGYVPSDTDATMDDVAMFQRRLLAVSRVLAAFGDCRTACSLPPEEAVRRAGVLGKLKREFDRQAVLILSAPSGRRFAGRDVWNVMLCLGLRWGDMDCFHWENRSDDGDDHLFSVETSTHPGYFLPERIAAGAVNVEDLVFGFSIPRCACPCRVFDAMARAVEYCRQRLGGTILDESGEPADIASTRAQIETLEHQLNAHGIPPGSYDAMILF
ncbi:MAG: cell division protein ZipA C-terminal FtsZ-binding domain-containing protein [Tepidisphaerales bacterium]